MHVFFESNKHWSWWECTQLLSLTVYFPYFPQCFSFFLTPPPLPHVPSNFPLILTQSTTFIAFPPSSSPEFLSSPFLSHFPSLLPSPYPSSHLIPSHVSTTHPPTRTRTICSLPPTPSPWVAARTLLSSWYVRTYVPPNVYCTVWSRAMRLTTFNSTPIYHTDSIINATNYYSTVNHHNLVTNCIFLTTTFLLCNHSASITLFVLFSCPFIPTLLFLFLWYS